MQKDRFEIITPFSEDHSGRPKQAVPKGDECMRCGTCCVSASPMLLKEDLSLFLSNVLNDTNTYTVRKGEPLLNRQEQELYFATFEFIKVDEDRGCVLYSGSGECSIYEQRPQQCRDYKCANTSPPLTGVEDRCITRKDLFSQVGQLYEIILKHEQTCSYERMVPLLESLQQGDSSAVEEILDMLTFDSTVRQFVLEHFGVSPKSLDLLFGRPMADILDYYDLEIVREQEGIVLREKTSCHGDLP